MNSSTPALVRIPVGIVSIPSASKDCPDVLVDAQDFDRLVSRGDLAITSMRPGRYFGVAGVPRVRYAPGQATYDRNERIALPALILRPRFGFRVEYVDPSRPFDCTRQNLRLVPVMAIP